MKKVLNPAAHNYDLVYTSICYTTDKAHTKTPIKTSKNIYEFIRIEN